MTYVIGRKIPEGEENGRSGEEEILVNKKFSTGWSLKESGVGWGDRIDMNLGTDMERGIAGRLNQYSGKCYLKIERDRSDSLSGGLNPENIKFDCQQPLVKKSFGIAECDITFSKSSKK